MKAGLAGICLLATLVALPAIAQQPVRGSDGRYRMTLPAQKPVKPIQSSPAIAPVAAPVAPPVMQPYVSPAMPVADAPVPAGPTPDVIVPVTGGQIGGEAWQDGTFAFKAVPFARPPVGDLRWALPQDVLTWQGVRFSKTSAPGCLQADYGWQAKISQASSEDCLYLEIRTPSLSHEAKKPVTCAH